MVIFSIRLHLRTLALCCCITMDLGVYLLNTCIHSIVENPYEMMLRVQQTLLAVGHWDVTSLSLSSFAVKCSCIPQRLMIKAWDKCSVGDLTPLNPRLYDSKSVHLLCHLVSPQHLEWDVAYNRCFINIFN